ncbi:FecCD family ABC transporter permease [Pectinatus frisingensis]|uniref:FecCD family ABC transporter permease n=1 Tax=Pectinatus frisingensis TaxID=865 RepID=UPI003D809C89
MNKIRPYILMVVLVVIFIIEFFLSLSIGSVHLGIKHIYNTLYNGIFSNVPIIAPSQGPFHDIVWLLRLPRILLAAIAGAGLAVGGAVMQAIVKNPLADPYVLGISSGASLGAVAAIFLGFGASFGANFIGICSFIGAFGISLLVLIISQIGKKSDSIKLLLTGMALNMACAAIASFIIYFANDKEGMQTIVFWLMGSFSGAQWNELHIIIPIVFLGIMFFWTQHRILDMMLLGDKTAVTLGINLRKYRQLYLLISAFIIGFIVYACGMIGFVGLIVPHVIRIFIGTCHRYLIPLAAITGAILLVMADVLCRIIINDTEIPVGIIVSLIGAPGFVYLIVKKSYSFGGEE